MTCYEEDTNKQTFTAISSEDSLSEDPLELSTGSFFSVEGTLNGVVVFAIAGFEDVEVLAGVSVILPLFDFTKFGVGVTTYHKTNPTLNYF